MVNALLIIVHIFLSLYYNRLEGLRLRFLTNEELIELFSLIDQKLNGKLNVKLH